jgi:thymidylate synthase ThyX
VTAASPEIIRAVLPAANVTTTRVATNARLLRQTLTQRPGGYQTQLYGLSLAAVPVA